MDGQSKYDLALLVSKRLRRRLLKFSGILVLPAVSFVGILLVIPDHALSSGPVWLIYFVFAVPVLSVLGAVYTFVYWLVTIVQAAILGTAVDDVIDEAERRGLIDRDD